MSKIRLYTKQKTATLWEAGLASHDCDVSDFRTEGRTEQDAITNLRGFCQLKISHYRAALAAVLGAERERAEKGKGKS
jgi:hypothetical protein